MTEISVTGAALSSPTLLVGEKPPFHRRDGICFSVFDAKSREPV
jgi:hypothetical protein